MKNTLRFKHFIKSLLVFMAIAPAGVYAQPAIQWDKTIGSTGSDQFSSVLQSTDGGYILTGTSAAAGIGGDRTEPTTGDYEPWLVKLGPAGTKIWDDIIDQYGMTRVISTIQTTDGGFVIAGGSEVADFLLKLDAARNVQWVYSFSPDNEFFTYTSLVEIAATTDGGFVAALTSNGRIQPGRKDENSIGGFDYLVIKYSATGAVQWNNTIGGTGHDNISSVRQTADGGYIVSGRSASGIGFDKTEAPKLGTDLWIVKLNASGVVVWDKTIGGPYVNSIIQTADGGYIAGGYSNTNAGGDKSENSKGEYDMWVVKLAPNGSVVWDRTIGGSGNDYLYGLFENPDGSIILGGESDSGIEGDKTEASRGSSDLWVVKLSGSGNKIWDKTLGGSSNETGNRNCLVKTADGGFIIGGTSNSGASGNKSENSKGGDDYWVVKLAPETPPLPQTTIRINAGGPNFTTATKKLFIADKYYAGIDRTSSIASGDILNTSNDVLYRSGRCSPSFSYNIPVVNGKNNVTLHFAEVYFGAPGKKGGKGSRQFHVNMEGNRKLTNYDIFATAGGAMRAVQLTIPVTVTDGTLNIDFLTGAADMPRVSAIEVSPAVSPVLEPIADSYVQGGLLEDVTSGFVYEFHVKGSASQPSKNASAYLKFQLQTAAPVTSAKLRIFGQNRENTKGVFLHAYGVNDDNWSEERINQLNAPAASTTSLGYVSVNNVLKYYEIDVTSYVKAQQQSGDGLISLLLNEPANRNIKMSFSSKEDVGPNPPQLVIQTTNSSVRIGEEEVLTETQEKQPSSIFPNPAKDYLMLEVSTGHKSEVDLELTNLTGSQFQLQRPEIEDNSSRLKVGLPGQLPAGMYLLKVQSKEFSEVLKVLVAQ